MKITIPEVTFTIPQIEPTTAIIIILLLSIFLVYWHLRYIRYLPRRKGTNHIRLPHIRKCISVKNLTTNPIFQMRKASTRITYSRVGMN